MAITGGPGSGDSGSKGPYGLGDEGHTAISHGYDFYGLPKSKSGAGMSINKALDNFLVLARGNDQQRAQFAQIQAYLFQGGFYSSKKYVPTFGGYRLEDLAAMKNALRSAAGSKTALAEFFTSQAKLFQAGNGPAGGGARGPVLTVQYTDPTDIRRVAEKIAPDVIGRGLSDDEIGSLVDAFHGVEEGSQRKAFAAQTGGGGSYTAPPDLSTFAEQKAKELHPEDYKAYSELGFYNVLTDMVRGSGG